MDLQMREMSRLDAMTAICGEFSEARIEKIKKTSL